MLLKLLSKQDKYDFILIAELLTICDKPILQDGKEINIIAPEINFILLPQQSTHSSNLFGNRGMLPSQHIPEFTIQKNEKEVALIEELKNEGDGYINYTHSKSVEEKLLKQVSAYSLQNIQKPSTRMAAATAVLKELLTGKLSDFPSVPKIILFELMQVALFDGNISDIKLQLLNEFKHHSKLEDYVFDELLERAKVTIRELKKTIAIIFE